jgi:uncharacterized protein YndB with AHSA1/START domain
MDVRPGGRFAILEQGEDGEIDHFGTYAEIHRPNRLAFSLQVPRHFPGITHVTIDIAPTGDGAELVLSQTGVSPEVTEPSWRWMLARLADLLRHQ